MQRSRYAYTSAWLVSGTGMNCASCHSVRCLRVNQTVMKSFSSPLKRRYQRNDAVRSVTSWRSAATNGPPAVSSRAAQSSMHATAAAISSSSGRSTMGTGPLRSVPAQPHSTSRPEASSSCSSTNARAAARHVYRRARSTAAVDSLSAASGSSKTRPTAAA